MSSPLVTMVVLGYNQEQFIRDAIAGAFAQTYSPLEIILSDDCSQDRTFDIMQEMAAAYKGPHRVVLNQTPRNLRLCAHLDSVAKLAQGEWIVIAAGDDISLPDRVANHMRLAQQHPQAHSTFLSPILLGNPRADDTVPKVVNRILCYPETLKAYGGGVLGATQAVRRSTWQVFGDLGPDNTLEDWVIAFRSSLLGEVVWDNCPGIRYRLHEQSFTSRNFGKKVLGRQLRVECNALNQFAKDLQVAIQVGSISAESGQVSSRWLAQAIKSNHQIIDCMEADTFWKFLKACGRMLASRDFVVGNYRRRLGIVLAAMRAGLFARGNRSAQPNL